VRRTFERSAQNRLDIVPAVAHRFRRSLVSRCVCP
jgi:hypothetical protein